MREVEWTSKVQELKVLFKDSTYKKDNTFIEYMNSLIGIIEK